MPMMLVVLYMAASAVSGAARDMAAAVADSLAAGCMAAAVVSSALAGCMATAAADGYAAGCVAAAATGSAHAGCMVIASGGSAGSGARSRLGFQQPVTVGFRLRGRPLPQQHPTSTGNVPDGVCDNILICTKYRHRS